MVTFSLFWQRANCLLCHEGGATAAAWCVCVEAQCNRFFAPMREHFRVYNNVAGTCAAES